MAYVQSVGGRSYRFPDLKTLLAKASPARSGDYLAGLAAAEDSERVAAQMALADAPLKIFLNEALIPYEQDEVTRLIVDEHDSGAFAPVSGLTVGDFRNWLLGPAADEAALTKLAPGLTPEMVAADPDMLRARPVNAKTFWDDLAKALDANPVVGRDVAPMGELARSVLALREWWAGWRALLVRVALEADAVLLE